MSETPIGPHEANAQREQAQRDTEVLKNGEARIRELTPIYEVILAEAPKALARLEASGLPVGTIYSVVVGARQCQKQLSILSIRLPVWRPILGVEHVVERRACWVLYCQGGGGAEIEALLMVHLASNGKLYYVDDENPRPLQMLVERDLPYIGEHALLAAYDRIQQLGR